MSHQGFEFLKEMLREGGEEDMAVLFIAVGARTWLPGSHFFPLSPAASDDALAFANIPEIVHRRSAAVWMGDRECCNGSPTSQGGSGGNVE